MRVAVDRPEHARAVCREIEARFTNATPALYCVPAREDAEETAEANIINSCLSSCTYCLVSDRRSAALNWEGVVPSHVRKAR